MESAEGFGLGCHRDSARGLGPEHGDLGHAWLIGHNRDGHQGPERDHPGGRVRRMAPVRDDHPEHPDR